MMMNLEHDMQILKRGNLGAYMLDIMEQSCKNGDAYLTKETLCQKACRKNPGLSKTLFLEGLAWQMLRGNVIKFRDCCYLKKNWYYELYAAQRLAFLLQKNELSVPISEAWLDVCCGDLCEEQKDAIRLAFTHRICLILGGPGTGKTTMIKALIHAARAEKAYRLCAPTGKAARNLESRTGLFAETVHCALGVKPGMHFLSLAEWDDTELVAVDEAGTLTLEMLAGILCRTPRNSRIVLLGDENQLQAVGCGNIIRDLQAIGVPCLRLCKNHRQQKEIGLAKNISLFQFAAPPEICFLTKLAAYRVSEMKWKHFMIWWNMRHRHI